MPLTVRVRNFQSIEDATLVVDGLTVITGTNNTGKSAFFRALRGAFTNTQGHGFVRNGASHCTVDVNFHDAHLQWEKGPKANRYKVGSLVLSKVGHGPPAEVEALGVKALTVAGRDVWPQIAPQISGVQFLLDQPAPILAEALADVERVNHINRALRLCETDRKQAKSDLKAHQEMHQSLLAQQQAFSKLDDDLATLAVLETEHAELAVLRERILELEPLQQRLHTSHSVLLALQGLEVVVLPSLEEVAELTELRTQILSLESLQQRLQSSRATLATLQGLELVDLPTEKDSAQLHKYHQAMALVTDLSSRLAKAKEDARKYEDGGSLERIQQELQMFALPVEELKGVVAKANELAKQQQSIRQHRDELRLCNQLLETTKETHQQAQDVVTQALGTFSECPTCGGNFQTSK